MGIIKAIAGAIGGSLADQWLEVIEPNEMSDTTVFTSGVTVRNNDKRNSNSKGTDAVISNGSIIHVYDNQCMILIDGGKIVDYSCEPGYYKVSSSTAPSLFNGQFGDSLKDSFERIKFSGVTATMQKVFYINLQEIKGIKFGTPTPINYFDNFYNSELFLRAHGTYSIKIADPLLFYREAIPRNASIVNINDINEQYLAEFLTALQSAINQMSADGIRISFVSSKGVELSKYMSKILDEDWTAMRGFAVQAVGLASISYDDESKELINMRNKAAMISDPTILNAYNSSSIARGIEAAGSNAGGSMAGFMGVGMGMQANGGFFGSGIGQQPQQQQQPQATVSQPQTSAIVGWTCECGKTNTGKFCADCGKPQPIQKAGWTCGCGVTNSGKFCAECGKPCPPQKVKCDKCGFEPDISNGIPKFCPECGDIINDSDKQ